jgi:hypothetical protein
MASRKYQANVQQSTGDEPLTQGESATFELFLDEAAAVNQAM